MTACWPNRDPVVHLVPAGLIRPLPNWYLMNLSCAQSDSFDDDPGGDVFPQCHHKLSG